MNSATHKSGRTCGSWLSDYNLEARRPDVEVKYRSELKSRGSSHTGQVSNSSFNLNIRWEDTFQDRISVVIANACLRHIILNIDDCGTWHNINGIPLLKAICLNEDSSSCFSSSDDNDEEKRYDWKNLNTWMKKQIQIGTSCRKFHIATLSYIVCIAG